LTIASASARFASAVADMPTSAWAAVLDARSGSAARVVWRRLREVEVHHVDLAAGYTTADWSEAFTHRLLHELITDLPKAGSELPAVALHAAELGHPLHLGTGDPTVTVTGPGHALAGWLAGRGDGAALTVDPAGPLPTLSDWM
jgi:maleylpyruvate isomerase